jgi:hypothetical protein
MKHRITERRDRVLSILLCIRDIPGSNLGPETEYSEFFRGFPLYLQANAGIVP